MPDRYYIVRWRGTGPTPPAAEVASAVALGVTHAEERRAAESGSLYGFGVIEAADLDTTTAEEIWHG